MKRLSALLVVLALAAAVPFGAPGLRAQEPVTSKQELARTKFRELQDRMEKLHASLAKEKETADDAKVLERGLLFVQEAKVREALDRVKVMLDQERWGESLEAMQDVRTDLTKLLDLLQNRNMDLAKLLEQIARLEKFRNRVDQLVKDQGAEKDDSAHAEELQKQLEAIEKAKEKVEQLLAQQKDVRESTNQLGLQAAAEATKPLADKQGQLKEDTEKLAEKLKDIESKVAEAKAGKPAAGKPGEPKAGEPKPGESKPSSGGSCSGSASKAAGSMSKSQQQLGDKKPESSLKDQDHAIEQLQNTKKQLEDLAEEARRELLKLPFEQLAKKQDQTQHETDTLAKDMEKSEQQGDNGEGKPTPGRKNVQQAVPKQKAAAGTLKEYKPAKAKQEQQDAKEDLEKARQELDDALAQLRQQLQEQVLKALEERFTAMLARQKQLSETTRVVDKTRGNVLTADGALPMALAEKCQAIAGGETDLSIECDDAMKLLAEDGTAAIFPVIVEDLKDQLDNVAKELRGNDTGDRVQGHQAEIEDTLTLLINALRRAIQHKEGGG